MCVVGGKLVSYLSSDIVQHSCIHAIHSSLFITISISHLVVQRVLDMTVKHERRSSSNSCCYNISST